MSKVFEYYTAEDFDHEINGNINGYIDIDSLSNIIHKLPDSEIKKITYCDLSDNELTELPKEICNLINLETLNLSHNKLTELPKEIGNLINIYSLTLSNNKLTYLPKELGNLNLLSLDFRDNLFKDYPKIDNMINIYPSYCYFHKKMFNTSCYAQLQSRCP